MALMDRLRRHPLLGCLGQDWIERLAKQGVRRRLEPGQMLFGRGDENALAYVLSGRLDVVSGDREPVTMRRLAPDSLVGLSTLAGAVHTADIVAGEHSEVLVFPASTVKTLFKSNPELALQTIAHLAELVATLSAELDELREPDLASRVLSRLRRLGVGRREVAVTHEELAAQVGATRANVSRALARLERAGLLIRGRGRIELL